MAEIIRFNTSQKEVLVDITMEVRQLIQQSRVMDGVVNLFTPDGSAGILIQSDENAESSRDVLDLLKILIPEGVWLHDSGDGNADAHLKAGLVGPSKTIPLVNGELLLSENQRVFYCDFNGPNQGCQVVCTLLPDR